MPVRFSSLLVFFPLVFRGYAALDMNKTSNHFSLLGRIRQLLHLLPIAFLATGLAFPFAAQAQLVLSSSAPTTENFNTLGTTATGALPTGFKLSAEAAPSYGSSNNYVALTQATNGGSFTSGGTYNFGADAGAAYVDRAVGFLASGSYLTPRHILLEVKNSTGASMQDVKVQFELEKYRTGTRAFDWKFYTSTDGINWTAQTAGDHSYAADLNNTTYYSSSTSLPLSVAKSVTVAGVNLANEASLYLRWSYVGVGGSTNAQGLGLDNLTITPTLAGGGTPTPVNTIATSGIGTSSFCVTSSAGSATFDVAFTSSGTFTGTYKVQLSDGRGIFSSSPSTGIIGSGSASPISAVIPAGTPSGNGYRVRVINDAPATYGSNNGADLTVSQTPSSLTVSFAPASGQTFSTTETGATLTATATAGSSFTWAYSTSATGPFSSAIAGASAATYQPNGADFPGAGTYYLVAQASFTAECGTVTGQSEPVTITVTPPSSVPSIEVSVASLPDFGALAAGAGAQPKSFTVSGSNLTDDLTITPPAGFEIRTGNNPFACCTIVLAPAGGSVPNTTIEVRFTPTAAQPYQAAIPVSSTGLTGQEVAVSGTGIAPVFPATLSTVALTELTSTSVKTGGIVELDGGSAVSARGVVWAKTPNPTLSASKTADGAGAGEFASAITGLLPGTTYFVRAYATNAISTTFGEELTFTTVEVPLAVEPTTPAALTASQVTSTSLQLDLKGGNGQKRLVLAHLSAPVDATPTDATTYTADAAFGKGQVLGTGNYVVYNGSADAVTITNLRPNTPYSFSVFAFNDNDTPYAENYLTTEPGTLTLTTPPAPAALLLEENFEYPAAALLTANNWSAHSGAGTKPVAVTATGLSYAGYSEGLGNAAAIIASGEDVNRKFEPVYARTPLYFSFLVNVANATATGDYFFHLGPQTIGSTFRSRVFVRKNTTTNKVQFGINGGSGTTTYSSEEFSLNTTVLLVVKYAFDEEGNVTQLFINPTTNTEPSSASVSVAESGTSPKAPNDNIGSVALRQGASSPNLMIDGIRVGTTFRVVKTGSTCVPPELTVASLPVVASDPNQCGASVAFTSSVSGSPAPELTYSIMKDGQTVSITSPYFFPVGTTIVTASATNGCGSDSETFTVTVEDQQAPEVLTQNVTVALEKGVATVTAAQVDKGSSDACGIVSLVVSPSTFTCENIGLNTVTLTATDTHGNTAVRTATVTVVGTVPAPAIAVNPSSTVNTGGVATHLYLGYGPQSVTLAASGGVSYQWSPATGLSSTTSASPVFKATTAGTFTYTVTATNNSGCTATKSVTLTVTEVSCGNLNDKVTICHNGKTMCVVARDVADHLNHGDQLGDCLKVKSATAQLQGESDAVQAATLEAFPNPFAERATLRFRAISTGQAELLLYNTLGQVVRTVYSGAVQAGKQYEFTVEGAALPAGLYTGRLLLNGKVQTVRMTLRR